MKKTSNKYVGLSNDFLQINPEMPKPCALLHTRIREAALQKWGSNVLIPYDEVKDWLEEGAPDAKGDIISTATHVPQLPGQGSTQSHVILDQLVSEKIFLYVNPDS